MTSISPKTLSIGVATLSVATGGITMTTVLLLRKEKTKNIEQKLREESFTPLNMDVTKANHDETWKRLIKKHQASVNSSKKINGLIFSRDAKQTPIAEDIKLIKNKCKELIQKKETEKRADTYLQNAKDWCTEQSEFAKDE